MTHRNRILAVFIGLAAAQPLQAQIGVPGSGLANPMVLLVIMGALALLPFVAIMMTSFVRISIVFSLVRSGLGTQQVPPPQVTNGLALILTLFIMAPVAQDMSRLSGINNTAQVFELNNLTELYKGADRAKEPLRKFLLQHAHIEDRNLFLSLARRMEQSERIRNGADTAPEAPPATATAPPVPENEEFRIVVPAFITSELKASFQAGFLILLPFLVIDLVVANIIVATGLSMVQPAVISLPVKILLFVLADGWTLIVKGLVLSYA